jgi:hypothetical protein
MRYIDFNDIVGVVYVGITIMAILSFYGRI